MKAKGDCGCAVSNRLLCITATYYILSQADVLSEPFTGNESTEPHRR